MGGYAVETGSYFLYMGIFLFDTCKFSCQCNNSVKISAFLRRENIMAFIQMNIMSYSLMRTVSVNVILPAKKFSWGQKREKGRKHKTPFML